MSDDRADSQDCEGADRKTEWALRTRNPSQATGSVSLIWNQAQTGLLLMIARLRRATRKSSDNEPVPDFRTARQAGHASGHQQHLIAAWH